MSNKKIIRLSVTPKGFGQIPDELEPDMFASELPVQHSYEYYEDDDLGLYVGVWDTTDMIEAAGPYACDEFMWLLEGEATIKNNKTGAMEKVRAGEAFVIPKGYDCQWHQTGYLRKFFFIYENPNESIPEDPAYEGIIIPKANASVEPMASVEPFLIIGDTPVQQARACYTDNTGRFLSGTWECDPFSAESRPFPYHQFSYVQTGALALIDETGEEHTFKAGEAFFVAAGTVCSGRAAEKVRLFFAILLPE